MNNSNIEVNAMKQKIAEEYLSSLADLNVNSKPLINMLTILAEENIEHADAIIKVVEQHIAKVDAEVKLPVLYLIDSIVKNVGGQYIQLFSQCIVNIFVGVFDKVKENVREKMYALRQTWVEVFPPQKLYTLDVKVKCIDQNWPITAKVPAPSIHVNPKFLTNESKDPTDMQAKLLAKQRELLELQNRKLEMELEATKLRLQVQEQRLQSELKGSAPVAVTAPVVNKPNNVVSEITATLPNSQLNVHVNKNYPFNQVRANMRKNPVINNVQNNFPPTSNAVPNRPRVAPVNSAMLSTLSRRDPRLARQQQQQQQQQQQTHQKQEQSVHHDIKVSEQIITVSQSKIDTRSNESQKSRTEENSFNSFGRKRSEERSLDDRNANKSKLKGSLISSSKDRRSPLDKDFKATSKNSEKIRSSNRSERNEKQRDRERHRDKDKKYSEKKSKDSIEEKTKSKDDKHQKDGITGSGSQALEAPMPPKLNDLSYHDRMNSKRSPSKTPSNYNASSSKELKLKENKSRNKSPSPQSKEKIRIEKDVPEKRIKLTTTTTTNISNTTVITSSTAIPSNTITSSTSIVTEPSSVITSNTNKEKLSKISKLEQKADKNDGIKISPASINPNKDIDLRTITKMEIEVDTNDLINIEKIKKSDEKSSNKIEKVEIRPNIIGNQKRISSDEYNLDEPSTKKSKSDEIDQKIDILFGTEDVDLRKLPAPEVSPPPPPMISNENESWAKVKGVKVTSSSEKLTNKSSLDDVRAKLAKAAKNNNYSFGKGVKKQIKKPIVEEYNDDSQDGASENIRTIISQAQELLESKSISSDQYNTLVKTAMQINETNKLKEAQRRESLTLQNDKENKSDDTKSIYTTSSPKEQRKKLPKIPKTSESKQNNSESKPIEPKKSEVTQEFNEPVKRSNSPLNKQDEKDKESIISNPTRRRRKESKWSSMTPWEIQQQKQQNWMLQQQQQQQQSAGVPPPPFPPKLLTIPPGPQGGLGQASNNQWQNSPSMIFGGNALQPIAAASLSNNNNTSNPPNSGISGPAFSNSVNNPQDDIVRTIPIDGISKEIRIYDDVAIVFMDWDQPREIGFQNGSRRIIIDNQDAIALNFNDDFVNITIGGSIHGIKYGFPSRELYIDANWYECYFGGPPVTIPLDGKFHVLQIEGPPPQVHIGPIRQDLVIGKINLVIDAHVVIPVFLDARPQSFELYNKKHVIQFTDALCTALIDNEPMDVEYGGLPKSFNLNGEKHFIRFTTLPNGIIPGKVLIKNMICTKTIEHMIIDDFKSDLEANSNTIPPLLPGISSIITSSIAPLGVPITTIDKNSVVPDLSLVSNSLLNLNPNTIAPMDQNAGISSIAPATSTKSSIPAIATTSVGSVTSSVLPSALNMDELFQKLLASGILNNQTKAEEKKKEEEQQKEANKVIPIDLKKSESIKTRQAGIVNTLFSGMQCSSCGLRFPPEQTIKYSQHLDWHFRQNRRERDSNRKAHSRKWYYDLTDWLQYEEIEDLEDREKNWFETQQVDLETDDNSNQKFQSPQPSCRAEVDDVDRACEICLEKFEHFYNEELEEWHLKSAIKVDKAYYHPICYKDLQDAIAKEAKEPEPEIEKKEETEEIEECIEIDDSVIIVKQERSQYNGKKGQNEDEDDDVIVLPNEEPSITEIPDDDEDVDEITPSTNKETTENSSIEITTENEKTSQAEPSTTNDASSAPLDNEITNNLIDKTVRNISMEDDIVIQEPQIPFQDLDSYVEKDLSHLNEDSTQSSFANIKIKEEPKDDDEDEIIEEDDAFEDVGTVEIINDSIDSPLSATPILEVEEETNEDQNMNSVMLDDDASSSVNISIDGNVKNNNVPSQKLGVNKIKINIAKNIVNSSNNSNLNNNNNSNNNKINDIENETNKLDTLETQQQQQHQKQQQISTIPVITTNQNFNRREFNIYNSNLTTIPQNSSTTTTITTTLTNTNNSNNKISNNNNNSNSSQTNISILNKSSNSSSTSSSIVTTSLLSNSNTLISIPTMDIDSSATQNNNNDDDENDEKDKEIPKIEFKYKPELENIEFKTVEKLEKGYETSGLCSIM